MQGFTAAWLVGTGIVAWRQFHAQGHLPVPGALAGVTGLFAALAIIADVAPGSRQVVTWTAWGLNIAGLLNILPAGLSGQISQTATAQTAAATSGGDNAGSGGTIVGGNSSSGGMAV